jgi:transcriptional regulator with XRE-family HTH domain
LDRRAEQTIISDLAVRIRELRRVKGWSQERLAEEASMHRTYLAGIERGLRNPALKNLIKIAHALDVSLSELFDMQKRTE